MLRQVERVIGMRLSVAQDLTGEGLPQRAAPAANDRARREDGAEKAAARPPRGAKPQRRKRSRRSRQEGAPVRFGSRAA